MNTVKGHAQNFMISSYKKEGSYNAAVVVNAANFACIRGHSDYNPDWGDEVDTGRDRVDGTEHGSGLDMGIIARHFKTTIVQPMAVPDFVIAAAASGLGGITATQDAALAAWRKVCEPVAVGTALPSFNLIGKKGAHQYLHKGCKTNSFTLSGEGGKVTGGEWEIVGSGHRAVNADSFVTPLTESWMLMKNGYAWLESGADIAITNPPAQGVENISSATPENLKDRLKKFTFKWNNNLEKQPGFGEGADAVDMDYTRRKAELGITLRYADEADLAFYEAMTALAFEVQIKGALITAGSVMYFGYSLIVPRFKLVKPVLPQGGVNDSLTIDYECDVQNDGVNSPVIFTGWNSKAAYFAA